MATRTILIHCLGFALLFFTGEKVFAFDNVKDHPEFNAAIVDRFVEKTLKEQTTKGPFSNYQFLLNHSLKLDGPAVAANGWASVNETVMSKTPREWVMHGGYSADEPELPAGVRHFYDPKGIDNKKTWLTDISGYLESAIRTSMTGDPQTDAKNWAFHHVENKWNWIVGKQCMVDALQEQDSKKRNVLMAKSWRALGEVLHLIADMALPPHVRNDSHPVSGKAIFDYMFGDPDPCEALFETKFIDDNKAKTVEPTLQSSLQKATSAEDLFELLATFTNENFFSSGTISGLGGKQWSQIIDGRPEYTSPKLENLQYDIIDYYYYKNFPSGANVKICRDLRFIKRRGYPYIDRACVESMAQIWVPAVIEAGYLAMKHFIPKFTVTITSYDAKTRKVKGQVRHLTDKEYPNSISYNGPVNITSELYDNYGTLTSVSGSFEGTLSKAPSTIRAEIQVGGMYVKSETVGAKQSGPLTLSTRPSPPLSMELCTLEVIGDGMPDSAMIHYMSMDLIGGSIDGQKQLYYFDTAGVHQLIAQIYYRDLSSIWKTDTFTVTVRDTVIIDSITPATVLAGYDQVRIYGKRFGSETGKVFFDSIEAKVNYWSGAPNSSNFILAYVPAGIDSIASVRLKTRRTSSNIVPVKVLKGPRIRAVKPSSPRHGENLTISGSEFGYGKDLTEMVYFANERDALVGYSSEKALFWNDTSISFKIAPSMMSGQTYIRKRFGGTYIYSDTALVKIVPNFDSMKKVKANLTIANCLFEDQAGKQTTKSLEFNVDIPVISINPYRIDGQFDSSYTISSTQVTIFRKIRVDIDTCRERVKRIEVMNQQTTVTESGSKTVKGDTLIVDNLAVKLVTRTFTPDSLTGYSADYAIVKDTLLTNISMLRSMNYVQPSSASATWSKLKTYPQKYVSGFVSLYLDVYK